MAICQCNLYEVCAICDPAKFKVLQMEANQRKARNGSPIFYALLEQMSEIHNRKSHDYASNESPYANYQFAGKLSKLFDNPDDAGFIGRIGEKLYRLANLENSGKKPSNESVEDTEIDICVIMALWVASRRERRHHTTSMAQFFKCSLCTLEMPTGSMLPVNSFGCIHDWKLKDGCASL